MKKTRSRGITQIQKNSIKQNRTSKLTHIL